MLREKQKVVVLNTFSTKVSDQTIYFFIKKELKKLLRD